MNKTSTITNIIQKQNNTKEIMTLLNILLSPQEINSIYNRIQIISQLKKDIPQSQIAKNLNTGIATVTRGSKVLQNKNIKNITQWWG